MRQTFRLPFLRQHKDFRGADQRYVGLALDVLLVYLDWRPESYFGQDFGKISDMKSLSMFEKSQKEGKGRQITIRKIRERGGFFGYTEYVVEGFPEERDYKDFKRDIKRIYRDIMFNRINFKNPQFSI